MLADELTMTPKVSLTAEEIARVVSIAEETQRLFGRPIVTVRGPETAAALAHVLDTSDWGRLPPLGKVWFQHPGAETAGVPTASRVAGPSIPRGAIRMHRKVGIFFENSEKWLGGIPIGVNEHHTQALIGVNNKFNHTQDTNDVAWDELQALESLSQGKKWMSQEQVRRDGLRKDAARSAQTEDNLDPAGTMAAKLGPALAAALVSAGVVQKPAAASLGELSDEEIQAEATRRRMAKARAAKGAKSEESAE